MSNYRADQQTNKPWAQPSSNKRQQIALIKLPAYRDAVTRKREKAVTTLTCVLVCDCDGQCCGVPDDDVVSRLAELVKTLNECSARSRSLWKRRRRRRERKLVRICRSPCRLTAACWRIQIPASAASAWLWITTINASSAGTGTIRRVHPDCPRSCSYAAAWRFVFHLRLLFILHTKHETVSFLIQVLEDDGLPTSICLECVMKVNVAYELRKQCQKADVELRKLYGKSLKTNIASIPTKVFSSLYE